MKNRLTMLFVFLWCAALIRFSLVKEEAIDGDMQVVGAFAGLGLADMRAELELTGEWDPSNMGEWSQSESGRWIRSVSDAQIRETLRQAASVLGICADAKVEAEEKENGTVWTITGSITDMDQCEGTAAIVSVSDKIVSEYYFRVSVIVSGDPVQSVPLRQRMEEIGRKENLDSLVCVRLSASYDTVLSERERIQQKEHFLQAVNAGVVEEAEEGSLYMTYAYQEHLNSAVSLGGRDVNLTLMFRDNQINTRCFVGLPVVLSDD